MKMYRTIVSSLLKEKPPGWKKALMAYFHKDKVIPEEMHTFSQLPTEGQKEDCYILVKLLSYGPEPNYQIRATHSMNAISELTAVKADCLTYQYVKALIKLLGIKNLGSYTIKKLFLTDKNNWRKAVNTQAALNPELNNLCSCLLYTSPSPRDLSTSRMPSSA